MGCALFASIPTAPTAGFTATALSCPVRAELFSKQLPGNHKPQVLLNGLDLSNVVVTECDLWEALLCGNVFVRILLTPCEWLLACWENANFLHKLEGQLHK